MVNLLTYSHGLTIYGHRNANLMRGERAGVVYTGEREAWVRHYRLLTTTQKEVVVVRWMPDSSPGKK